MPTLEFHSVDDPIVEVERREAEHRPSGFTVDRLSTQWVQADGCDASSGTRAGPANTGLTATLVTYGSCRGGAEVRLWRFTGSGHVWPGAPFNTGPRNTWILDGVGRGTTLVDANEEMWTFFRQHELPA